MAPSRSILKNRDSRKPSDELFARTKDDKRRIKHANLMNKVAKSATKAPRRRRPHNKLVTTLDALADALPDEDTNETHHAAAGAGPETQVNAIQRKSIKSRPGAMKRREKVDREERDRFAKNMAQMTAKPAHNQHIQTSSVSSTPFSDRMAALRGFISETLERRPDIQTATG